MHCTSTSRPPYSYASSYFPLALHGYPCTSTGILSRSTFLLSHLAPCLRGAWALASTGELWVPVATYLILVQLAALVLLPHQRAYTGLMRPVCTVLIGVAPKACSLFALLRPCSAQMPSTYFTWYLPYEGIITGWQLWVYQVRHHACRQLYLTLPKRTPR